DHVLEGLLGENLRLVEHLDVDLVEPAAKPLLAGAEHDDRTATERDLLLAVGGTNVRNVRRYLLPARVPLQVLKGVRGRARPVRRPNHPSAREQRTQREHDPADQESLRHLPRDRQRDTADRRGVDPVSTLAEDQLTRATLPLVKLVAPLAALRLNVMPSGRDDPRRVDDVPSNLR